MRGKRRVEALDSVAEAAEAVAEPAEAEVLVARAAAEGPEQVRAALAAQAMAMRVEELALVVEAAWVDPGEREVDPVAVVQVAEAPALAAVVWVADPGEVAELVAVAWEAEPAEVLDTGAVEQVEASPGNG